jgi:hypothetical protein
MMFDKLCGMAENRLIDAYSPDRMHIIDLLKDAKIFEFNDHTYERYIAKIKEELDFINETFFLPFQTVAIEEPGYGVVIHHDLEENVSGLRIGRAYLSFSSVASVLETENKNKPNIEEARKRVYESWRNIYGADYRDCYYVRNGMVIPRLLIDNDNELSFEIDGSVNQFFIVTKSDIIFSTEYDPKNDEQTKEYNKQSEVTLNHVADSYKKLLALIARDMFVVKNTIERKIKKNLAKGNSSNSKPQKINEPNLIPRSMNRPTYTIMNLTEIREKYGLAQEEAGKEIEERAPYSPTYRKAHLRTLRHEKWGNRQGDRVKVKATWVGPREKVIGNKRYKVILDPSDE